MRTIINMMRATIIVGILIGANCFAEDLRVNTSRAIVIDGVIANGNINDLGTLLVSLSQNEEGRKLPVDMIINSPGGEVITGFLFLNLMRSAQANGLRIRCFVPTMAASMAFQIFLHCDERYVVDKSFLLWHRARVSLGRTALTGPELQYLASELTKTDAYLFNELVDKLDIPERVVRYHFEKETLHIGSQLAAFAPNFVQSFPSIPGLFETLLNEKVPRSTRRGFFDMFDKLRIIYIHPQFLVHSNK